MKDKMLCRAGLPESEFNGIIHCELDWMDCLRSQLPMLNCVFHGLV